MSFRAVMGISIVALLAACSARSSEGTASADSADIVAKQWTTGLDRTLSPAIEVSSVAELGRSLDDITQAEAAGLEARDEGADTEGCKSTWYQGVPTARVVQRITCPVTASPDSRPMNIVRVYDWPKPMPIRLWADHNLDGRSDTFTSEAGPIVEADDDDFDGRVDRIVETVESLGGTVDLGPFSNGAATWALEPGATFANRIRVDTDHDGKFDQESVTAHDPTHAKVLGFER